MQIFVSVPSGRTITLDVEREDSVSILRSKIEAKEGLAADLQRLVFAGRQLEDGETLAEAAVGREATVHAVLRLLGGRGHGLVGAAFDLEPADVAAHCCQAGAAGGSAAVRARDADEDPIRFLEDDLVSADNLDALFDLPSMGRQTSMQWDQSDAAWGDLDASVGFFDAKPADDNDAQSDDLSGSATPEFVPEEEAPVEAMAVEEAAPAPVAVPAPAPVPARPARTQRARAAVVVQTSLEIDNPKLIQKSHKGLSYNLDEVDDKLRKRLLKNRLSAERSRQRKNAERRNLEEQLDAKNDENQALRSELDRMRALLDKHKIAY